MPNVAFKRAELRNRLAQYETILDCIEGEIAVKARKTKYLPVPSEAGDVRSARYISYSTRVVFYNVVKHMLGAMVGSVMSVDPVSNLPAELENLRLNATGEGVSLDQLAKAALELNVSIGRGGLFVDFPETEDGVTTVAQASAGRVMPTIELYSAPEIINWRTTVIDNIERLSLVVLEEKYVEKDDGFEVREKPQWRVLLLDENNLYRVEIWRTKVGAWKSFEPRDASGNRLREIPFAFFGANSNSPAVSPPPMYDIASLNIGHFRNSADYEESVYLVGQPTPWYSGLTATWVKDVWKDGVVPFGSRAAITLPANASAGLLQAQPNTLAREAMDQKERQMVALGARLVQPASVQRTATEAALDDAANNSVLISCAHNINSAMTAALKFAAVYAGSSGKIEYAVNTAPDLAVLSDADRQHALAEWQGGAITFTEMRNQLRRGKIATEDDAIALAKIAEEAAKLAPIEPGDDPDPEPEPEPGKE